MKLENQVCSLDLAKRMTALGVKQESIFYWRYGYSTSEKFDRGRSLGLEGTFRDYELSYFPKPRFTTADVKGNQADLMYLDQTELSAFSGAELGEMLPEEAEKKETEYYLTVRRILGNEWEVSYSDSRVSVIHQKADTEADARAKMLIYLIDNGLIPLE